MEEENYNYTDEDVISWFKINYGIKKSRKREYLDPRNYVIALLYQKFAYIEEDLANIFLVDRSTINACKTHTYTLLIEYEDQQFVRNTKALVKRFPWVFINSNYLNKSKKLTRKINIKTLKLEDYDKITRLALAKNMSKESLLVKLIEEALNNINE